MPQVRMSEVDGVFMSADRQYKHMYTANHVFDSSNVLNALHVDESANYRSLSLESV